MAKRGARKPSKARVKRELYVLTADQSLWELIKRGTRDVVLKNAFTSETRRPTTITFARDYEAFDGQKGRRS